MNIGLLMNMTQFHKFIQLRGPFWSIIVIIHLLIINFLIEDEEVDYQSSLVVKAYECISYNKIGI